MFNLGSDDKDELQENMKEIKNLIDKGGSEGQQNQGLDDSGLSGERENDNSTQFEQKVQQNAQQENSPSQGGDSFSQNMSEDTQHDFPGNDNQDTGNNMQNSQPGNNMQGSPGNNQSRGNGLGSSQSMQQPSEDKVINDDEEDQNVRTSSPESEETVERSGEEPLFLREEQFNDVREMVEEMRYLTQEMGQKVDRMKKTVRDERDISKDSEELVQAFSQRRSKVKSTINSGQN